MLHLEVFTDGSVNNQLKVGYGAYLVVSEQSVSIDRLKHNVKIKRFVQTSSTKLELQTLLWALDEIITLADESDITLCIYTDSQNIIGLPGRQSALEQSHFFTGKNNRLNNYELYQEFYRLTSRIQYKLVKVLGHQVSSNKDETDTLFGLVDKASRRALREEF
ncbi:ribonuclease HI [Paraglaciecola sp. MB-3u-78]|jgi:ribonuclease HI|uniref:ribonuclease HI n=1 Tax=Paraglaciecola sp. MB-3u-78 TaxID=2058332 RepID=UPI000C327E72|nr:RNase H family protein [Paraglaciecola sp. MB-3u-78]PKG96091.1 ribonuclease H [Paraglaciecola sp. MB-3u-78]